MKFMIMNYKPYEYELLLNKLNKLGKDGYTTDELSLLTFFHKTDKPVYYHIDFHKTYGSSKSERLADKNAFARKYQQKGLQPIYAKHNMYVFTSKKEPNITIDWKEKENIAKGGIKFLSLGGFFISLIALTLFSQYLFNASFDKFLTYGITLTYIGLLLLFITCIFRNFYNYHNMSLFYTKIKKSSPHLPLKKLSFLKRLYTILTLLTALLLFGGLIEDVCNQRSFTPQDHRIIQLEDFNINKDTSLSTQAYSSFTLPHTYISLEEAKNGNESLYIKEFELTSLKKAENIFKEMKNNPRLSASHHTKVDGSLIYGYNDSNDLVSITILHDQTITMLIPTFEITQEYINTMIDFYK